MIKENDVVESIKDISEAIPRGTVGTVVYCYDRHKFIVEFIDKDKNFIDCVDVSSDKIRLIWKSSI